MKAFRSWIWVIENSFKIVNALGEVNKVKKSIILLFLAFHCISEGLNYEAKLLGIRSFAPGEKLIYKIKWGIFTSGKVSFEVMPEIRINGVSGYHFVMTAKTNFIADRIYKVRDYFEGFCDTDMTQSFGFNKKLNEGKRSKDIIVEFDWQNYRVHFSNFATESKTISISPNTVDPISFFYKLRTMDLEASQAYSIPVTDGEEWFRGRIRVEKGPKIKSPLGKLPTLLVEPDMESYGWIFKTSETNTIKSMAF